MRRDTQLAVASLLLVMAALVPFRQTFQTGEWRGPVALALIVSLSLATVARRLAAPLLLSAAISLLGLAVFTSVVYSGEAGPWPDADTLEALRLLLAEGLEDVRLQPAPTPVLDGIMLLLTAGVWAVAHIVHEALVRYERTGPAFVAAGTLWLMPLAVPRAPDPSWQNMLPLFIAVGALLVLIQPRESGRWTRERSANPGLATGVSLTVTASIIAVFVPSLLPGYGAPAWLDVSGGGDPRGYQPIVDVGDRLHLPSPRDVLRVRSTNSNYLRLAALDTFDGRTWRLGPPDVPTYRPDPDNLYETDGPLPFEALISRGREVTARIDVLDLENIYVPIPYQLSLIEGPPGAGMFYSTEGGFVATGDVTDNELSGELRVGVREGFSYDVEALVPTPLYEELVALGDVQRSPNDPLVALPSAYPDLAAQAEAIYVAADATTTIDRTLAVQEWFIGANSTFTYSTNVPELRGDDALLDFVFSSQTGYCEYFSTAMAVMLRATGIPARVSVGFLPGRLSTPPSLPRGPGIFTVSTTDAHAWVEVYFEGFGWVRMDPTPRSSALPATIDDLVPQPAADDLRGEEPLERPSTEASPLDQPTEAASESATSAEEAVGGAAGSAATGIAGRGLAVLAMVVLLLTMTVALMQLLPALRRWQDRHLADPISVVLAAQRRVLVTAEHLGFGRRADETAAEVAQRWADEGIAPTGATEAFVRLSMQAAFAGRADQHDANEMLDVERELLAAFGDARGTTARLTEPVIQMGRRLVERLRRARSRVS